MRVSAERDIARVDLALFRQLVAPLWDEWARLTFASDGWLTDPDDGRRLEVVRLSAGRHRAPGAHYTIVDHKWSWDFALASDTGRNVRGTLSTRRWSVDLEINDQVSALGRVDVAAVLRGNDVPGLLIPLIGGRAATGHVNIDPSRLESGGTVLAGEGTAQRCAGDVTGHLKTGRHDWHVRLTVHVHGRGLLGRSAFLIFRSQVRPAVQEAVDETLKNIAEEAARFTAEAGQLDEMIDGAGGPGPFVHKYLWDGLRNVAPSAKTSAKRATPSTAGPVAASKSAHLRRGLLGIRRWERSAEFRFPLRAEQFLVSHGSLLKTSQLIVRTDGHHLRAHWPSQGRYDSPPAFTGAVTREPANLVITGVIRETRSGRAWALAWGFATALMVLVAGLGIGGMIGNPGTDYLAPLLIGVITAPVFALFWRSARADREPDFDRKSRQLEDGLRKWFLYGDGG